MNKEDLLNINGGGDNKKDFKKILIYGAVVFLIFVIGVIAFAIYKNMNQPKEESILPPQVKQEPLFKQVPIEQKTSTTPNTTSTKLQTQNIKKSKEENNTKKTSNSMNIKEELLKNQKKVQQKNIQKQPNNTINKPSINSNIKPKKEKNKTVVSKKDYYIQVAALLKYKKPNKDFLKLIEKYGYKYRFYVTYIKRNHEKIKVTKILVGPFTKDEAEKNLIKVKKYITQNAFIFKVK